MKTKKIMAASLASVLLVSGMAIPATAFSPSSSNFSTLFDFDNTPTAKYAVGGVEPGSRQDLVGDSKSQKCITADSVGYTYDLTIVGNGGQSGKALKLDVTDNAPVDGAFCPVGLYPTYGEHKNPTVPNGYIATDFAFWIDCTKFHDTLAQKDKTEEHKGILLYFQEKDYDKSGKEVKNPTAWWPKTNSEGGYWQIENGSGWKSLPMNSSNKDHDFYVPNNYRGWVKIPLSNFELVTGGDWNQSDQDGKIDAKCVEQISLGMGNYEKQKGSSVIFDSFGFMIQSASKPTTTGAKPTTTTAAPSNTTAAGGTASTDASTDSTDVTDTTEALDTTFAADTPITKLATTTATAAVVNPNNNSHAGLIIAIVAIVVVLGGAGTGFFFFNKKVKEDGFASIADYFKSKKNSSK